jgi:hypothetical protein
MVIITSIEGIHGKRGDEESFGREVREKEMSSVILKGENPIFLLRILLFHNMNVELSMGRMQRE